MHKHTQSLIRTTLIAYFLARDADEGVDEAMGKGKGPNVVHLRPVPLGGNAFAPEVLKTFAAFSKNGFDLREFLLKPNTFLGKFF